MKFWGRRVGIVVLITSLLIPVKVVSETKQVGDRILALEFDIVSLQVRLIERKHTHIGLVNGMKHRPQFQMASEETKATLEDSKFNSLFLKQYEETAYLFKRERENLSIEALVEIDNEEDLALYIEGFENKMAKELLKLSELIEASNIYIASRYDEISESGGGADHYEAVARAENFVDTYTLGLYSYQQAYKIALAKRQGISWNEHEYATYVTVLTRYENMLNEVQTYVFEK